MFKTEVAERAGDH